MLKCATHGIHCSSAGGYQTALQLPHAPNRDARNVTVRYKYMYRATPSMYVYQVKSSQVELYCHSATCGDIQWNEMSCLTGPRCYINTDIQQ